MNPLYSTRLHTRNPLFFQEFIRIQKKFKIFPPICRLSDALRLKIDVICRNKAVLHVLIVVLQRQPDGVGVQVAVIAARYAVLLQKRQNLRAGIPAVARRIVQKAVFFRVSRQLLQSLGHDPSPEEISAEMGMPVDKVREILKIAQEPVSLETPIGEEEDSHLGDFIPDEGASEPSEAASFTLLQEQLVDVLSTLTPREEKVLKLRFGIEDGRPRTLEEVGKEFNVTRERIRQIEAKALRKLRHPSRSKKLKDFLN